MPNQTPYLIKTLIQHTLILPQKFNNKKGNYC
jgi:hypothetical protein